MFRSRFRLSDQAISVTGRFVVIGRPASAPRFSNDHTCGVDGTVAKEPAWRATPSFRQGLTGRDPSMLGERRDHEFIAIEGKGLIVSRKMIDADRLKSY